MSKCYNLNWLVFLVPNECRIKVYIGATTRFECEDVQNCKKISVGCGYETKIILSNL